MRLAIVDLEMLQPGNEIIDVGAVLLDCKRKLIDMPFDHLANPGVPMTDYKLRNGQTITELTGITQEMLDNAEPLRIVLAKFWAWLEEQQCGCRCGAWGAGDLPELVRQSEALNIKVPEKLKPINVKWMGAMFRSAHPGRGIKAQGGLKNTMDLAGLQLVGKEHRALPDAVNTARLTLHFWELLNKQLLIERIVKETP